MLFKNASIFSTQTTDFSELADRLAAAQFRPIASNEVVSFGFEPVFEDQLVLQSHGHLLLKFTREKKVVPKSAVDDLVRERAAVLEEDYGHPPGKKAMKEIKEAAQDEMIARALSTRSSCRVWIDMKAGRVIVDSTSNPMIDMISTALVKHAEMDLRHFERWPSLKEITNWFKDGGDNLPADLTLDDAAQFEMPGSLGTQITFRKADLTTSEVIHHIEEGAQVLSVAVTYKDRLSFTLCQGGQLRGIKALDILDEAQAAPDVDRFENDFILAATEIGGTIDYLADLA